MRYLKITYAASAALFFLAGGMLIQYGLSFVYVRSSIVYTVRPLLALSGLAFAYCFFLGRYKGNFYYWLTSLVYFAAGLSTLAASSTNYEILFLMLMFVFIASLPIVVWPVNKIRMKDPFEKKNFFKVYFGYA
ncbi:hypothetical protein V5738_18545 [Salinisphaera sp. SPP-AMP-43]|uniref:hypothetical protein n=1 Tax=Salinisphaera sp. SPP-AMP-43 TaxID=3121288 RepID=UPI003C6E6C6C